MAACITNNKELKKRMLPDIFTIIIVRANILKFL